MQASYSSSEVLTIIGAVGGLVTLVAAAIVNIIVALRTNKKLDVNTAVTQDVSAKADVITGHVNGAAAAAVAKMAAQQAEIDSLRQQLADRKETALLLAQAVAARPARQDGGRSTDALGGTSAEPIAVAIVNTPLAVTTKADDPV